MFAHLITPPVLVLSPFLWVCRRCYTKFTSSTLYLIQCTKVSLCCWLPNCVFCYFSVGRNLIVGKRCLLHYLISPSIIEHNISLCCYIHYNQLCLSPSPSDLKQQATLQTCFVDKPVSHGASINQGPHVICNNCKICH